MKKFLLSLLKVILLIFFIVLTLFGYIFLRYRSWEKAFEKEINSEYIIDKDVIGGIDMSEKISDFALSFDEVSSLELTVTEMGSVLYSSLDSYFDDDIAVKRIYIIPSNSKWILYTDIEYKEMSLWLSIDLNKDAIQSPQIYITQVFVGPFDIGDFRNSVDSINTGIAQSIVTLNENGFVGRYIENIELTKDFVILKGSRY